MSKGWLEILANAATLFMCVVVSWAVLWHFALSPKRDGVPSGTRPSVASIGHGWRPRCPPSHSRGVRPPDDGHRGREFGLHCMQ